MRGCSMMIVLKKRFSRWAFTNEVKGDLVNCPGVEDALSSGLSLEKQLLVCFARMAFLMFGGNSPYLLKVNGKYWSKPHPTSPIFQI